MRAPRVLPRAGRAHRERWAADATLLHRLGHADPPARAAPDREVVDLAIEHRVASALLQHAGDAFDAEQRARLRAATLAAAHRHLAAWAALTRLLPRLRAADIPHLVVKGPVLQAAWGDLARPYVDLDLLVPAAALADALDVLHRDGAETVDRNWDLLVEERRAEVHVRLADGQPVDLHWHLVNHGEQRDRLAITVDDLLAGARTVICDGVPIPTLGRAETLVHTCIHAATSGAHHLVWMLDVAHLLDPAGDARPTQADILTVARRWQAGLPVAAMLARAARTVGAEVEPGTVEALAPTAPQRALVRALASWRAGGRLPGGGSTDRAVARALRPTLGGTARATARQGGSMLRRLVDQHEYWTDPTDPRHVCFERGDRGFDDYLAMAKAG